MAIFITGDTHGDFQRFKKEIFYEQAELSKEDFVIICGDFGGVWAGTSQERYWLNWLDSKPYTTLFVTGNHENYDILSTFPVEEWNGGKIQRICPSVIHLMRGQIYDFNGKRFFTMGGASSHDIADGILDPDDSMFKQKRRRLNARGGMYRVNHRSWWKEELPNEEEYQEARRNLERAGWKVDYIITHCCPSKIQDTFGSGLYQRDTLTDFFDEVAQKAEFLCWLFGHYHENMAIEKKYVMLYEQIVKLYGVANGNRHTIAI